MWVRFLPGARTYKNHASMVFYVSDHGQDSETSVGSTRYYKNLENSARRRAVFDISIQIRRNLV